jgi:hypothetical protein
MADSSWHICSSYPPLIARADQIALHGRSIRVGPRRENIDAVLRSLEHVRKAVSCDIAAPADHERLQPAGCDQLIDSCPFTVQGFGGFPHRHGVLHDAVLARLQSFKDTHDIPRLTPSNNKSDHGPVGFFSTSPLRFVRHDGLVGAICFPLRKSGADGNQTGPCSDFGFTRSSPSDRLHAASEMSLPMLPYRPTEPRRDSYRKPCGHESRDYCGKVRPENANPLARAHKRCPPKQRASQRKSIQ